MLLELQQVVVPKNAADGTSDDASEPFEGRHHVAPVVAGRHTSLQAVHPRKPARMRGIGSCDLSLS
jgi:hypothetical protein